MDIFRHKFENLFTMININEITFQHVILSTNLFHLYFTAYNMFLQDRKIAQYSSHSHLKFTFYITPNNSNVYNVTKCDKDMNDPPYSEALS